MSLMRLPAATRTPSISNECVSVTNKSAFGTSGASADRATRVGNTPLTHALAGSLLLNRYRARRDRSLKLAGQAEDYLSRLRSHQQGLLRRRRRRIEPGRGCIHPSGVSTDHWDCRLPASMISIRAEIAIAMPAEVLWPILSDPDEPGSVRGTVPRAPGTGWRLAVGRACRRPDPVAQFPSGPLR